MRRLTSALCIAALVPAAHAELTPKSHIGPAGIDFQSQVGVDYGHDDNVTYQQNAAPAVASDFWTVTPTLQAVGERGEDKYTLMYSGEFRRYDDSAADDYDRHFFMMDNAWRFGRMHGFTLNISQTLGQEKRGQDMSEGFTDSQFAEYGFDEQGLKNSLLDTSVRYSYGAPEGRGKLEVLLQRKQLHFRDTDDIEQASPAFYDYLLEQEWREDSLVVDLFDQYSSKSRFRYSFITNRRHYEHASNKRSNEYYLLFGLKSERTGKTTIEGNVALLYKEFPNDENAEDFKGFNWDIEANWKPVKHSEFTLYTWQKVKDPEQEGGYVLDNKYGIAWTHYWWVDRFSTTLDYGYQTDDYRIPNKDRFDKNQVAKVTIGYDFRPSIRLEMNYQWSDMRSNKETDAFFINNGNTQVLRHLGYEQSLIQLQLKVQI
ncbi:capsular biosynthesis protein [Vibrio sp. Vb2880]|uniref:Capsular biosynthesis protein n=1 Tax=Vibrio furnissii TaxID=29494 RepID=A0A0Q2MG60_VIBFU|nr:outer membrane beta-barrel protein [Vibrio furnissii]MBO0212794.1 capsular biosynthesis protein [Vibrio sp. Vb2880]KQH86690.1 capsular biosynthesis protein [Vibrio furnissii]MCG6216665.1 outer membrane beta-barrel protein [Vibrio furnissii]MCG6233855.1 outer membrane beta-barrel protein [Vibrio furnissii]MCG6259947.1 outer membrane beta-barrel protein [Vibrio furnissii]